VALADRLACDIAGSASESSNAIIATTTNTSIKVKAGRFNGCDPKEN
jgi:hypothetical protein